VAHREVLGKHIRMEQAGSLIPKESREEQQLAKYRRDEARKLERMKQFAPKGKRAAVEKNAEKITKDLEQARLWEKYHVRGLAADQCTQCTAERMTQCMCALSESECANGHKWHWCREHHLRVNNECVNKNGPCTDHA
jgi:hypothetical protein